MAMPAIADKNIDLAESVKRPFHHRIHLRFLRYIGWYCEGLVTEGSHLVCDSFNL